MAMRDVLYQSDIDALMTAVPAGAVEQPIRRGQILSRHRSDPDTVDHVIPGNDDALRAIRLFASKMADAVIEGRGLSAAHEADAEADAEEEAAAAGIEPDAGSAAPTPAGQQPAGSAPSAVT